MAGPATSACRLVNGIGFECTTLAAFHAVKLLLGEQPHGVVLTTDVALCTCALSVDPRAHGVTSLSRIELDDALSRFARWPAGSGVHARAHRLLLSAQLVDEQSTALLAELGVLVMGNVEDRVFSALQSYLCVSAAATLPELGSAGIELRRVRMRCDSPGGAEGAAAPPNEPNLLCILECIGADAADASAESEERPPGWR